MHVLDNIGNLGSSQSRACTVDYINLHADSLRWSEAEHTTRVCRNLTMKAGADLQDSKANKCFCVAWSSRLSRILNTQHLDLHGPT